MNTLFVGFLFLIWLALVIYMLSLATRLVKAVEKIANQSKNIE